jgi:hypothetical protein
MYAATYKQMRDRLQPSIMESAQEDISQAEKSKRLKRNTNSADECCTKKQKRPPPAYQNPRPVAANNFFAPLRDLLMENLETGRVGNSMKIP